MFVLIRAVVWSTMFVGLVLLYIPRQLLTGFGFDRSLSTPLGIGGFVVGSVGALIAVSCIGSFVALGKGTPAPFDPPVHLVTRGPYRFVRNPMYLGAILVLVGAAAVYRSWIVLGYSGFFLIVTHLFVVLYEEPALRRTFGDAYVQYCSNVHRWWPFRVVDPRSGVTRGSAGGTQTEAKR